MKYRLDLVTKLLPPTSPLADRACMTGLATRSSLDDANRLAAEESFSSANVSHAA